MTLSRRSGEIPMRDDAPQEESLTMTTPTPSPRKPLASRTTLDDDVARAVIRARVRRHHRRAHRVLTRV